MSVKPAQRILITGAGGFVGAQLAARVRLRFPTAEVFAVTHARDGADGSGLAVDITKPGAVEALIRRTQPDCLVHLAAVSAVASSLNHQGLAWKVNTLGTMHLVSAVTKHAPHCHFIFASSGEVYGRSALAGAPLREDDRLQPANPYAASKAAADLLVQEAAHRNLAATVVRPFNHTGPGQSERFVTPAFCSQIAQIERGLQAPVIHVGELDDERDFLDVSDVVELYLKIIERRDELEPATVLNAASGTARRIGDILAFLLARTPCAIQVEVDQSRLRPTRIPRLIGDAARARETLDWRPQTVFEDTLAATLQYWRARA